METKEIRRINLRHQMNKALKDGLSKAEFAEKCGSSASAISQILGFNAVRNLGDVLARKIEVNLSLPRGWMDLMHPEIDYTSGLSNEARILGDIQPWDSQTPLDDEEIEVPFLKSVKLAAGCGSTVTEDQEGFKLRFAKSTLRRLGVQFDNAVCVEVIGNSMEPVLPNGATVGVDTGATEVRDGKMYAIDYGDLLRVKLLYVLPNGRMRIRSYNTEEHEDEETDASNIKVLGRVFWSSVTY